MCRLIQIQFKSDWPGRLRLNGKRPGAIDPKLKFAMMQRSRSSPPPVNRPPNGAAVAVGDEFRRESAMP
jgi:hypothetical protein